MRDAGSAIFYGYMRCYNCDRAEEFLRARNKRRLCAAIGKSHGLGANCSGRQSLSEAGQQLPIGLAKRSAQAKLRPFPIGKRLIQHLLAFGSEAVQAPSILADLHANPSALSRIRKPSR